MKQPDFSGKPYRRRRQPSLPCFDLTGVVEELLQAGQQASRVHGVGSALEQIAVKWNRLRRPIWPRESALIIDVERIHAFKRDQQVITFECDPL